MRILLLIIACFLSNNLWAQDDLLNMLENENPDKPTPVFATFKSTRVITGQSNEQVARKHLNFVIMHRFGEVNGGAYEFYGLDQANMRLALDYGISNNIQLGIARASLGKNYDGNIKIKLLSQSKGKGGWPVSIVFYGNMAINSEHWADPDRENFFTSRITYFSQLILAKKMNDRISLQIAPTLVHYNLVSYNTYPNTTYSLGTGASIKLNKSLRLNLEYYPRLTGREITTTSGGKYYDYLAIGFDLETGGHVFQLMLANGVGMLEQQMVRETTSSWKDWGIRLGFNISRTFSFDSPKK